MSIISRLRKSKKLKTILKAIEALFLVPIFSLGLVILFSLLPFERNYNIYAVLSGSMRPAIDVGSLVFSRPQNSYAQGDIISFDSDEGEKVRIVTHRISETKGESPPLFFFTKGDANAEPDSAPVLQSQVRGRVVFTLPLVGYVLGATKTFTGLILIVIIPATIIIYEDLKKIFAELKRIKRRRQG